MTMASIEQASVEVAKDIDDEVHSVAEEDQDPKPKKRVPWSRPVAFGVLPVMAILLASGAGYLNWLDSSARSAQTASIEAVRAATDGTVAMLSYRPDTVDADLGKARDRLSGDFKDAYTSLTRDVVIPGSKQKQISAVAAVPAVGVESATENQVVVVIFVNQTVTIGTGAPTSTASSVRVRLDHIGDRWLISQFDPV